MRSILLAVVTAILVFSSAHAVFADLHTVTSRENDGPATLRAVLAAISAGDSVEFSLSGEANSITVYAPLTVSVPCTITGNTTVIGGSDSGADVFLVTANNVTFSQLAILGGANGVHVQNSNDFTLFDSRIGTDWSDATGRGCSQAGIRLTNAMNCAIGTAGNRNVISGNEVGVMLEGGSFSNWVRNSYIGTNSTGTAALANTFGVRITGGSSSNTIGGDRASAQHNVISGNSQDGVRIDAIGGASTNNDIAGNIIGLDASQSSLLANTLCGVQVIQSTGNRVGINLANRGNVLAGGGTCLTIDRSNNTSVQNNLIGLNEGSVTFVGNNSGCLVADSYGCLIGGPDASERNVISGFSGSNQYGLGLQTSMGNTVQANFIGTDLAGNSAVANADGIRMTSASGNWITGNILAGNSGNGIRIDTSNGNRFTANRIGVNASGLMLQNIMGINFGNTACLNNQVGTGIVADRNVIAGNSTGIWAGVGSVGLKVQGNYLGCNPAGTLQIRNFGTDMSYNGKEALIGGATASMGNFFSGGSVQFMNATGNTIASNVFGLLPSGGAPATPPTMGLYFTQCSNNWIGYPTGPGNLIARVNSGVTLFQSASIAMLANTICACTYPVYMTSSNGNKAAPVITGASTNLIQGTASAGDTIEVFRAEAIVGGFGGSQYRLGSTVADAAGAWNVSVVLAAGQYVTAMATDGSNNTSNFAVNTQVTIPSTTPSASPTATITSTVTPTPTVTPVLTATPTATPTIILISTSPFATAGRIIAFPNPARQQVTFLFHAEHAGEAIVRVFNAGGESVAVLKANVLAGPQTLTWHSDTVAPGIYFTQVEVGGTAKTIRVAVVR